MTIPHLFACFFLVVSLSVLGQPSTLVTTKQAVQFEIKQKANLKLRADQLEDEYNLLDKMQVTDEQILRVLQLEHDLQRFIRMIDDANARQATLSEKIKLLATVKGNSVQEDTIYRQCSLTLTELAHTQLDLLKTSNRYLKNLRIFLRRLPPPHDLTLSNGLKLTLVRDERHGFYVSSPLTTSLPELASASNVAVSGNCLTPTHLQARKLVIAMSRNLHIPLSLPSQNQLEAMAQGTNKPDVAVWSMDQFKTRNSLEYARRRNRGGSAPQKLELTPAQINAVSRFKIPFYLVWDPNHVLGDDDFTRELPQAHNEKLGVVVTAPLHIGTAQKLATLKKQYRKSQLKDAHEN